MTIDDIDNPPDRAPAKPASTTQDNSILSRFECEPTFKASRTVHPDRAKAHFAVVAIGADPELVDAKAGETWRALRYRWARYERWCLETNRVELPCSAAQMRDYVRALIAERMAPTTIGAYVAAISTVARLRESSVDRSLISEHLKAARRRAGPPRKARPARGTIIAALFERCDPDSPRDVRDACIFALGFGLAARAGELVGLDWNRAASRELGSTGVIQIEDGAIVVRWSRSKTAQDREVELEISDAEMPEARLLLERWINLSDIASGTPLLRPLTKHGTIIQARLSTVAISTAIRRRIVELECSRGASFEDARNRAVNFSSHSLRRGFCTSAAEAGVPLNIIRLRSRHRDDTVLAGYVGAAEGRRRSGLAGLISVRKKLASE